MPNFRKVTDLLESRGGGGFEVGGLPDSEKEQLCRSLLAEFGVTQITRIREPDGEMIHSCCLPFGGHKNGDANPSASLNYKKLVYNCRGCGNRGGLLWFIGVCRGTSGNEARSWLSAQTGTGSGEQSLASLLEYFDMVYNPANRAKAPIPKMNPAILTPWLAIHPYMTEIRHVPEETLKHFRVGYDPTARINTGHQWVSSERIVIPHFWKGDLVGWQSRRILNDGTPKYNSSPEFPKDQTIYNYDPRRPALVVESMLSVLRHFHHCPIIESTIGAAVTDVQLRLLAQHPKVILWMDNDEAGWHATEQVGEYLTNYSDVWVIDSPLAADPGDLDDQTFAMLMANAAVPFSVWKRPEKLFAWGDPA